MKNPKNPRTQTANGSPAVNSQKLSLLSLRLTRQQREKLNRLGGTTWLRQQIDNAPLNTQENNTGNTEPPESTPEYGNCQCKNARGIQCVRKANFVLKQIINGQLCEFSVCQEHKIAFQQGSVAISDQTAAS